MGDIATATAAPKYTLRGVKTFLGNEGHGLNATLCRDGKRVCMIIDDASGGMWEYQWFDRKGGESAEEKLFMAFIEAEREKIPADAVDKEFPTMNLRKSWGPDSWVNKEALRIEIAKQMRRHFKTYTCFQVGDKIGGEAFQRVKGHGPEVRAWIQKKYGSERIVIMNDMPEYQ